MHGLVHFYPSSLRSSVSVASENRPACFETFKTFEVLLQMAFSVFADFENYQAKQIIVVILFLPQAQENSTCVWPHICEVMCY